MKTTHKSLDLEKLAHIITNKLAQKSLDIFSIIVNCISQEDRINILVQHTPPVSSFPNEIFSVLKNILNQQYFKQSYQFNLFLAIYGEEPYATDTYDNTAQPQKTSQKNKKTKTITTKNKNRYLWLLLSGSFFSLTITYILTRPCVIGECKEIIKAQELLTKSQQQIKEENLLEAEINSNEALKLLQSIPKFSASHTQKQQLINQYQTTFHSLPLLLEEIKTGNQAIIASQKSPTSIQELTKIQEDLRRVINNLNTMTKISELENIVKNTQEIYQIELNKINKIYEQEIKAENDILTAAEMAQLATLRQEQAYTLEEWQLVNTTWLLVTNRLKPITPESISYPQAEQLLTKYKPIIRQAQDKLKQEETAYQQYQQAQKTAQQAKSFDNQKQYTLAIENWKKALETLSKINQKTAQFKEGQNLTTNYQASLQNSEKQLQLAQTREKANQDLDLICLTQEKICTYTLEQDNIIKVYLNPQYLQKVLQIAMSNQVQGDLLQHISSVQKALELVSNKYELPLEVYHSDGGLLFSYSPL
jgi:hypothetical protein